MGKNYLRLAAILLIVSTLLAAIIIIFYILSLILTSIGSLILFTLCLILSVRLLIRLIIFPGSVWFWRRSIEKNYSRIVSYQLILRTKELYTLLQNEMSSNQSSNYSNLILIIECLSNIVENLQALEAHYQINSMQQTLLSSLKKLISFLQGIIVIYKDNTFDLIAFCNDPPCRIEEITFVKDTLRLPTEIYKELEPLLSEGIKLFASLDYMRVDLQNKIKCEQLWLEMDDNVKIDCLWVPSGTSTAAVILCNPNAGIYEFSYYQTEWLEFYLDLGLNVFLWNYRGYGRSGGIASLERLKKDGEVIVNFIRTTKLCQKLGAHGESLGGCIAVYLAKECVLDFLVADRTFNSLPTVALFKFGKLGYWLYNLIRGEKYEYVSDYLASHCFKILLSDPRDSMIDDLSSLKSGIALRLISPETSMVDLGYLRSNLKVNLNHILSHPAISSCVESLLRLNQLFSLLSNESKSLNSSAYFKTLKSNSYTPINLETENMNEDVVLNCLERFFISINKIDAGGKNMIDVVEAKFPELGFIVWLMVLDVWGSNTRSAEDKISNHMKCVHIIRGVLQEVQSIQDEHEKSENFIIQQVFKDINTVFNVLIEVLGYMEERCGLSSDLDISMEKMMVEYQNAGILVPLSCGHSGTLNPAEKYIFSKHMMGFINANLIN